LPRLPKSANNSTSSNDEKASDEIDDDLPEFIEVTDILDLHGTPVKIIPELVHEFIDNAIELNLSQVHIIHGKGKSKLKHLVYQLLKAHAAVMQFYDAPPELGGWGRTIVELDVTAKC